MGVSNRSSLNIQQQVEKGIHILKRGGIVAYPTDTVYGLGACIGIPEAVERIYHVKERPRDIALPLLLADTAQIGEVAETVPPDAWLLIRRFMPGALTVVLNKSETVPDVVTGGATTVAVRIPDHPVPVALIRGVGTPIIGTSANITGRPAPLTAGEVHLQFADNIDLIIDGGRCSGSRESTIVDMTGNIPVVLREGAISKEELRQVCGNIVSREGS